MWPSRRKLAILAAISECLTHAEAKYCAFEIHGEPKYYVCPRTEYCCNFGCCVSPGFQIYHLWYYWLLVIIMFLVCSGGGWWYRYWLQGRYRPSTSTIPPRTSNSRAQNTLRGSTCRAQQARVTYNPARNTVFLHRMWKGPQRNTTPPAYNGAAASSAQFQNTNVVSNDNNCPYYELYGPPPSYETVIAQTRGKIMSPTAQEHSRINEHMPSMQSQNGVHCFSHNYSSLPTRIHIEEGIGERRNSCGSNLDEPENYQNFGNKNFGQKCDVQQVLRLSENIPMESCFQESTASGTRAGLPQQTIIKKLPFCVLENRTEMRDSSVRLHCSESSPDAFTNVAAKFNSKNALECNSSTACASGQFTKNLTITPRVNGIRPFRSSLNQAEELGLDELEAQIKQTEEPASDNRMRLDSKISGIPKIFRSSNSDTPTDGSILRYNRTDSGSLKGRSGISRWVTSKERYCDVHRYKDTGERDKRMLESTPKIGSEESAATTSRSTKYDSNCEECIAQIGGTISELNPSNNVILPSPNPNVQTNSLPPINIIENYQHYPPTSRAQRSTSTNFESENKLGRSKSLD